MNQSKRAFLKAGAALVASASLAPYAAMAEYKDGISAFITASFAKEQAEGRLSLSKEQMDMLQDLSGEKRGVFLSEIILRWLKKRFPDIPWPKVGDDIGKDLARQMTKQLEENGLGEGPTPAGISIKIKFKFKPPSDWEIGIEINF